MGDISQNLSLPEVCQSILDYKLSSDDGHRDLARLVKHYNSYCHKISHDDRIVIEAHLRKLVNFVHKDMLHMVPNEEIAADLCLLRNLRDVWGSAKLAIIDYDLSHRDAEQGLWALNAFCNEEMYDMTDDEYEFSRNYIGMMQWFVRYPHDMAVRWSIPMNGVH